MPSESSKEMSTWIVQRIEEHGAPTRTVELTQDDADRIYANWCDKIKAFNDQSISLIRVDRAEKLVVSHTNTNLRKVSTDDQ